MKETCIHCGKEIAFNKDSPAQNRQYYIKGIGQFCKDCYNSFFLPVSNPAVTVMRSEAPLPDNNRLRPQIKGLAYLVEEGLADDGIHKQFTLRQCFLFNDEETEGIKSSADVLGRFFSNLNRFEGVNDSYREFKDELKKMDERTGASLVDRRFRAYIMEWKLFLDHFEHYINNGAQTKHWKDYALKETYLKAFERYFKDVTSAAFDNNDCYKIACSIRNHISHAYDAVDWVNYVQKKVSIDRDKVIESLHKSVEQRKALERQEKKINLEWVADESIKVLTEVYEKLMSFLILDTEVIPAVLTMINAHQIIKESGIESEFWMICDFGEMKWHKSESQFATSTRVADEKGNPVDPPEIIKLPQLVPSTKMEYRSLNWKAYLGLAGLITRLHNEGLWMELEKKYFGYEMS